MTYLSTVFVFRPHLKHSSVSFFCWLMIECITACSCWYQLWWSHSIQCLRMFHEIEFWITAVVAVIPTLASFPDKGGEPTSSCTLTSCVATNRHSGIRDYGFASHLTDGDVSGFTHWSPRTTFIFGSSLNPTTWQALNNCYEAKLDSPKGNSESSDVLPWQLLWERWTYQHWLNS
jgi:hypothetical protein